MTFYDHDWAPLIRSQLAAIEHDQDLRVLLAVESGSRMWGFPSEDSDYDIRFIYVRNPDWYLRLDKRRDVIESGKEGPLQHITRPDYHDYAGWDLDKALTLFRKGNPPLLEWLRTDMVYHQKIWFTTKLKALMPLYFNKTAMSYHYQHMMVGNYTQYLMKEPVWIKKYFYVLRPLLSVMWLENNDGYPPLDFDELVRATVFDVDVRMAIWELLKRKVDGDELDRAPSIPVLSEFLEERLNELATKPFNYDEDEKAWGPLNGLFLETIATYWPI